MKLDDLGIIVYDDEERRKFEELLKTETPRIQEMGNKTLFFFKNSVWEGERKTSIREKK